MIKKVSIIGGDLRLVKLSEMLINEGAEVFTYGLENAEDVETKKCKSLKEAVELSDIIIGPIPLTSNGDTINSPFSKEKINVKSFIEILKNKTLIAGSIKPEVYNLAEEYNVQIIDILKREELSVLNAVSTAEGAIKIAIEETPKNLHGSNILVLGFGRIGKYNYVIIGAFIKKTTNSKGYQDNLLSKTKSYLAYKDCIIKNADNEDYIKLNQEYEQELYRILNGNKTKNKEFKKGGTN